MNRTFAALIISAVLWLASGAAPAAAAADPTVSLGPPALELAAGQTAALPVAVTEIRDLYGFEIHLRFDPTVVQVADADLASAGIQMAPGSFLSADFVALNRADNQTGTIDYAATQLNPQEPRSGSGTLLIIQFRGVAAGRSGFLQATSVFLSTRDGDPIPVTVTSGEISVTAAATAENSATPSPTEERRTATPSASATSKPPGAGGAATATRVFTNTPPANTPPAPVPAHSPTPPLSATPASMSAAPSPTLTIPLAVTSPTPAPLAPSAAASAAPSMAAPSTTASAPGPVVAAQPPAVAIATPARDSSARAGRPTPALVARTEGGDAATTILKPGASQASAASETPAAQPKQPIALWLLIAGSALLGLALTAAAAVAWLALHRGRA